jgi:dihydrofolate reductase
MAKLIYSSITSFDGYVADEDGNFAWSMPSDEVHAFVNDLERPIGTYLYGRRMYDVMKVWETPEAFDNPPPTMLDYAGIWQSAEKIVYSTTLTDVSTARTHIVAEFDADAVRELKVSSRRDISIGGPHLAAQAIRAGLVDEFHMFLSPVVIGGGNQSLPDNVRLDLDLLDQHRFPNGVVHLHYRSERADGSR